MYFFVPLLFYKAFSHCADKHTARRALKAVDNTSSCIPRVFAGEDAVSARCCAWSDVVKFECGMWGELRLVRDASRECCSIRWKQNLDLLTEDIPPLYLYLSNWTFGFLGIRNK